MKKIKLFEEFNSSEAHLNEAFEVHYSDGVRGMQKFNDKNKAIKFMKDKIANSKNLKEIAIYNAGSGFHSTADTDAVISWWGEGSYLDNVSKKDAKLAAKKLEESLIFEAKAKGLDWVISELGDKPKCMDVAEFVYDNYDKVTGLRKSMRNDEMDFPDEIMDVVEHYGLDIDEFTECYGMAAESVVTEGVVSIKGGRIIAHKVLNKLVDMGLIPVKKKSEDLLETIAKVITDAKMESLEINEGAVKAFEIDYANMEKAIKRGMGWIDPEYVEETWENSSNTIAFQLVKGEIYKRLIAAGLLWTSEDGEEKDKQIKSLKELGIKESVLNEAKTVKDEAISRLADFFRVPKSNLTKFRFDGTDDVRALTAALNSTSYEGTDAYYKTAIELAKEELGIKESVEINESYDVTVSLKHAKDAIALFNDMFIKYGKRPSTDVFSFKQKDAAVDFVQMLVKNLQIPMGEITADKDILKNLK